MRRKVESARGTNSRVANAALPPARIRGSEEVWDEGNRRRARNCLLEESVLPLAASVLAVALLTTSGALCVHKKL